MIAIDTHVLLWGIKGQSTANRTEMIQRARAWIAEQDRRRSVICLPTQALAEYLVDFAPDQRELQFTAIAKGFFLAPLDAEAARIAAELTADTELIRSLKAEEKLTKTCIKADVNIVASAIAAKATTIVSEDDGVLKIAKRSGRILGKRLETTEFEKPTRLASDPPK